MRPRGPTFGIVIFTRNGKMKEVDATMTTKGVVADADMEADVVVAVVDIIMAVTAADADIIEADAVTTVAVDTYVMVGAKATTRIRTEIINKVKARDIITANKAIIKNSNINKLDHQPLNQGNPTITLVQPGTSAILLKCHPVSTRVCVLSGRHPETTSLWAPITQFQARTSSSKW